MAEIHCLHFFVFIAALKLLSEPENVPAMINCAHGKDRTGIVSALVMSLLKVPRDLIVSEYAKSQVSADFRGLDLDALVRLSYHASCVC